MRQYLRRMIDAVVRRLLNVIVRFVATRPTLRALLIRLFRYLPKRLSDAIVRRRLYQATPTWFIEGTGSPIPENADWILGALLQSRPR